MSIKPTVNGITENDKKTTTKINTDMKTMTITEPMKHTFESIFVKQEINEFENDAAVKQEEITIKNKTLIQSLASNGIKSNKLDLKYLKTYIEANSCGYTSFEKDLLIHHLKPNKEKKAIPKPFQCNFCNRKFSWKIKLTEHLRTHTGEKPFSCSLCVYKTAWKHELVRHFRIHSGEKPFRCNVCDYKSNDKSGLNVHLRRHTGEKLFNCTYCDYKAVRKARLVKHLKTHDGK